MVAFIECNAGLAAKAFDLLGRLELLRARESTARRDVGVEEGTVV